MPVKKRTTTTFYNSDIAIDKNFDLKTHENNDYWDQEQFEDEDEGDDNASSDKDVPAKSQSQVPQNAVHLVLHAARNRCGKFFGWQEVIVISRLCSSVKTKEIER